MNTDRLPAAGYLLVEPPGVVRASTLDSAGLRAGVELEAAVGVGWDTLEHVCATAGHIVTPRGSFGIEAMRGPKGETVAMLLVLEEVAPPLGAGKAGSTIPPASATRLVEDIETVEGKDPAARGAVDLARRLARTMLPIYIAAEPGSGADTLARMIVRDSGSENATFVHVLASESGDESLQDRLFVSGPARSRGGTFYIEDAEQLDVATGQKLAREIDRGVLADTHFIASGTNDLRERVARGVFARELFTLVRSSTVTLPPLRDREDFELVVRRILVRLGAEKKGKPVEPTGIPADGRRAGSKSEGLAGGAPRAAPVGQAEPTYQVSPEAMRLLRSHTWPNNLRELIAWLERAVALAAPERVLLPQHFPVEAAEAGAPGSEAARQGLRRAAERSALEEALRSASGNVSLAAKKLGVARSTLYRMKQRYKVER